VRARADGHRRRAPRREAVREPRPAVPLPGGAYTVEYGVFADGAVVDDHRSIVDYGPAVADGKVYWPYQTRHGKASSGLLTTLDAKTGAMVWESPMTGATMSDGTPAVADGTVFVGNETADRVVAYDAATGARKWTSTARLGGWQDAAQAAGGGRVFIGSNNGVIARDATTGADLWTYCSTDTSWIPQNATPSTPAVAGETLYIVDASISTTLSRHRFARRRARPALPRAERSSTLRSAGRRPPHTYHQYARGGRRGEAKPVASR